MRKILHFLLFIILILLLSSSKPMFVKASSVGLSPEALQSISNGFQSLEYGGMVDYGVIPVQPMSETSYKSVLLDFMNDKQSRTTVIPSDVTYYNQIPYDIYDSVQDYILANSAGVTYESFSNIGYCEFDNGFFSGSALYDRSSGDLVYMLDTDQSLSSVCNVKWGGREFSSDDWKNTYSSASNAIKHDSFNYGLQAGSSPTYYLCYGGTYQGQPSYIRSCFISNQYIYGTIVPYNRYGNNGASIYQWYCNDLSLIQANDVLGGWNGLSVTEGSYTYDGATYRYFVEFSGNGFNVAYPDNTIENFLNGIQSYYNCFGKVGYDFNWSYYNSSVPFNPVDDDDVINVGDVYGLDDVIEGVGSWTSDPVVFNPGYDYNNPISDSNYPITRPLNDTVVLDPPISIPSDDVIVLDPDISQELPGVEAIPSGGFDIPIISDLQNRFPFSIPWDLKNMLKGLRSFPTAPRFQGDLYIRPIDYTYHIDIDLSMFDEQAELFRLLFLIAFIIGLARFSYTHFFGS